MLLDLCKILVTCQCIWMKYDTGWKKYSILQHKVQVPLHAGRTPSQLLWKKLSFQVAIFHNCLPEVSKMQPEKNLKKSLTNWLLGPVSLYLLIIILLLNIIITNITSKLYKLHGIQFIKTLNLCFVTLWPRLILLVVFY